MTIALLDSSRVPAGFLLVANGEEIRAGATLTCIVMAPPFPVPSAAREVLSARKHVEFTAAVTEEGAHLYVRGDLESEVLEVRLHSAGSGTWSLSTASGSLASGECERVSPK